MATKALTPVARRASHGPVSAERSAGKGQDWRQLLTSQNASLIWHNLSILAREIIPDNQHRLDQVTQECFLYLLATGRIEEYISGNYSNEEIRADLLSLLDQ
jgi:hypothetical protein